ncbi:GTPase EngA [Syntrophotalea carbinolica DSM 2380]|uniref:GTPase Der n=1 Tax=Syntrophotalea carbinolica (strain DSM 2380 / NBRC 103641 / GraBd1) TaxID=338963 RepID=DER_SYNC1|nr:ribosome biogenesis GTPase Der [Syntrophotalea carbinolica]Q3A4Q5.1 RecName: Full=GTPase Der; AltName: Full=GTP-binding protein EngA [Syntrophotalea carbinolica DSM 2380]ABA88652.1 GTPase EngA [Syntrophotalea carbinolica DSM 2380]
MSVVAIVGRPNVGKSTLFNRILGTRRAIVEDYPGVTRDRNYAQVTRYGTPFVLIDTGGFEPASQNRLLKQMREQSELAVEEADVILFVVDAKEGLTPSDDEVAGMLRRSGKPVLYVVNKVDGDSHEAAASEFYALGVDQLYTVSAEHGRGMDDLMAAVLAALPAPAKLDARSCEETRLAVIGRPNVGKSSLINRMIGVERLVANPTAGTTRDSIDTPFVYNKKSYVLIDTAGIRRKGRVQQKLEKYSVIQSLKAMERAHVVLVVIDAEEGVTEQDLTVAGYALERGRAVLLVVNKWDLVTKDHGTMKQYTEKVRHAFKFLPFAPIIFVSALSGQRVSKIMAEVEKVAIEFNRQVPTGVLNRVLEEAVLSHAPPMVQGKRLKFYYMTQTGVRPPSFVVFGNRATGVHFSYERYLSNKLREAFGFSGCPIRLKFKDRNARE